MLTLLHVKLIHVITNYYYYYYFLTKALQEQAVSQVSTLTVGTVATHQCH